MDGLSHALIEDCCLPFSCFCRFSSGRLWPKLRRYAAFFAAALRQQLGSPSRANDSMDATVPAAARNLASKVCDP